MTSEARLTARIVLRRTLPGVSFSLDAAFDFGPGLSLLFGPSGSGKTTVLSALAGLVRPDAGRIVLAGQVLFDAQDRVDLPPNERRIALVFQSLALFPHLSALHNVAYGLPRKASKADRTESALSWLTRMRVAHLADRHPNSFSGGEAQRVALARALASAPRALLLDEPFSSLDQGLARELSSELSEHVSAQGLPVVLVSHDRALARQHAGEVSLLQEGRVVRVGPALELLASDD